ncbi:MAG: hypothetical protein ACTSRK_20875, partial [Promethearchaeota archaeon]
MVPGTKRRLGFENISIEVSMGPEFAPIASVLSDGTGFIDHTSITGIIPYVCIAKYSFEGNMYYRATTATDSLDSVHRYDLHVYDEPHEEDDSATTGGDPAEPEFVFTSSNLVREWLWTEGTTGYNGWTVLSRSNPLTIQGVSDEQDAMWYSSVTGENQEIVVISPGFFYPTNILTQGNITVNFRTCRDIVTDIDYLPDDLFALDVLLYDENMDLINVYPLFSGQEHSYGNETVFLSPDDITIPTQLTIGLRISFNTGAYNTTFGCADLLSCLIRSVRAEFQYPPSWSSVSHLRQWEGVSFDSLTDTLQMTSINETHTFSGQGTETNVGGLTQSAGNLIFDYPINFSDPLYNNSEMNFCFNITVNQSQIESFDGLGFYQITFEN